MNEYFNNKTLLCKLSEKLTSLWKKSYSSNIFCYENEIKTEDSVIINFAKKIPVQKYFFKPIKSFFSKAIDNSFILKKTISFFEYLLSVSLKCYGWCFITFIAISLLFNVLNHTFSEDIALKSIIFSASLFPVLFFSKSISTVICESGLLSFLFLKLLGCERLILFSKNKSKGSISGSIIVGFIAGFFTLAYARSEILIFSLLLVLTAIFMCSTESAILFISLFFVFCPYKISLYLIFVTLLSYFIKFIRGKRSLYIKLHDFFPLLFVLIYILLSSKNDLTIVALIVPLLYFTFSGIARNEKLILQCISNITLSSGLFAFYNIIIYIIENYLIDFSSIFEKLSSGEMAFSHSASFSIIYLCAFAFSLSMLFYKKAKKRMAFFSMILNLTALYLSGTYFLFFACIFCFVFLIINYFKNKIVVFFSSSAILAISFKLLPLFSNSFNQFKNTVNITPQNFKYVFFGVNESRWIYNAEGVNNAGNLWLQLAFWGGLIFAIYIFISSVVFLRNGLFLYDKFNLKAKEISIIISCAVISYIAASFMCFSWDDYRSFMLFWILGGLSSSARRICVKEKTVFELELPEKI